MNNLNRPVFALFILVLSILLACRRDRSIDPELRLKDGIEIISPAAMIRGGQIPVVVRSSSHDFADRARLNGSFLLDVGGNQESIFLKRGCAGLLLDPGPEDEVLLAVDGFSAFRRIRVLDESGKKAVTGTLVDPTLWDSDVVRVLTGDVVVSDLTVRPGAVLLFADKANLIVTGSLTALGTEEEPIQFTAQDRESPWGGIELHDADAELSYCFFTHGGADASRVFGHSGSQAVLKADNSSLRLSNCFIFDNPGKAVGGMNSRVTIDNSLISRCDTGGETHSCLVSITNSHILDIPNDDGIFVDDDNDGFYFANVMDGAEEPSRIENSFVITGKDDAIDHNLARLEVNRCWLEGFMHEGVAGSNGNYVRVFNTVVKNCERGIEAGYTTPRVIVDHCVVVDNDFGLCFGDSYERGCYGSLDATNSILFNNGDNVYNYDLKIKSPREGAITIHYSMTNDADYDSSTGCIVGTPVFDDLYFLLKNSPGKNAAQDESDMGLVE